ncbi:Sorting nexin mvp1 [Arachnomyces sp. PD_36]|nr:Sorting nexin mvp1 [Arachnomyces sp. PD_36]
MSLFGTSPVEESPVANNTTRSKSSLFADDSTFGPTSSSTLFADDGAGKDDSPWSMPAPKRAARQEVVKTLLPATDVPEEYIDAYDLVLDAGERTGAGMSMAGVTKVLGGSGLKEREQNNILGIVLPGGGGSGQGLGRNEFNVLMALVGLAQVGEELTLDGVDERRGKLPQPRIQYIDELKSNRDDASHATQSEDAMKTSPNSSRPRRIREDSLGNHDIDPWAASPVSRRDDIPHMNGDGPSMNGFRSESSGAVDRGAGGYNAQPESQQSAGSNGQPSERTSGTSESGWGYSGTPGGGGFGNSDQPGIGGGLGAGFGRSGDDPGNPNRNSLGRSIGGGRVSAQGVEESVTITMLPEKEGMFMFQHRNYEVKSARRGSNVVRRYSDFVWLLDCLQKRYPFRLLPLLPPKRVSVNGTHLAADSTSFLEKRRRGLVRFTNALVRHPVLNQEQLVVMFLTVPTELAVWRKQATISVQEEFTGKSLPPDLEDSLPTNLADTFDTVRVGVRRSADIFINLCTLLERLTKRNQGLAADNLRFSFALRSLTDSTKDTYSIDTNDIPLLNDGISATARHLSTAQSLLEDEAKSWDEGVLEDLKRQRDCLVGMRDLFDRRDRYAKDNIPQLQRRIESNEKKLQDLRGKPEGTTKPGEIEKVEEAIFKDKESIVQQHARGVLIKECIRDELVYFQGSQYHISRLHQDWSQERVKYAELQADNWRSLSDEVEGMPLGD